MYVIGHGYAAVYVTYLAKAIIDANKDSSVVYDDKINLEGIMVGNPCTKID